MNRSRVAPNLISIAVFAAGLAAALPGTAVADSLAAIRRGEQAAVTFDFGADEAANGAIAVGPSTVYRPSPGYGFEAGNQVVASAEVVASDRPFFFSVQLPEGNYRVTVTLGGSSQPSNTTVKTETRRLAAWHVKTDAGQTAQRTFAVNIRNDVIDDSRRVRLHDRERVTPTWDDRLTLEFAGDHPAVDAITIEPAPDIPTLFIAGDSTVTDQGNAPWAGWGQMLPYFLDADIAVANHAESGRTLRSFEHEHRLDKILAQLRPDDYVLIQFGHNDMKQNGEGFGPYQNYKQELLSYTRRIRDHGGTPVMITPMHRRWFHDDGTVKESFGNYPDAMRQAAEESGTTLIDLHPMSRAFYEALGPEGSKQAFVHYSANTFADQDKALRDNTHHNPYGAFELARLVATGIYDSDLNGLKRHLADSFTPMDPSHPDDPATWNWPMTPRR